jgi:hypothetical protein
MQTEVPLNVGSDGTVVAHKTGTSSTVNGVTAATNDVGLVTLPNERHMVIAVFVSDTLSFVPFSLKLLVCYGSTHQ